MGATSARIRPATATLALFQLAALSFEPVITLWSRNVAESPHLVRLFAVGALTFALALGAWTALIRRGVSAVRSLAFVSFSVVAFYAWTLIRPIAHPKGTLANPLEDVFVAVLVAGAGALVFRFGEARAVGAALLGIAVVATAGPAISLVQKRITLRPASIRLAPPVEARSGRVHPDVYFVMLDAYARGDVLSSVYGFDNEPFVDELLGNGFTVARRANTNYSRTPASLASMLGMDYPLDPSRQLGPEELMALQRVTRGANPVVESLRGAGYEYVHIESGWTGTRCGAGVDRCVRAALLEDGTWALFDRTPMSMLFRRLWGHTFVRGGLHSLEALRRVVAEPGDRPRFVFAHVLLPHPPAVLGRDCRLRRDPRLDSLTLSSSDARLVGARRRGFVEQTKCLNEHLSDWMRALPPDAVAFVTSDHGPDSLVRIGGRRPEWTPGATAERLAILSAYRLPHRCRGSVYATITPVNAFRVILRCLLGADLPLLRDRSFLFDSVTSGADRFREVEPPQRFEARSRSAAPPSATDGGASRALSPRAGGSARG